MNPKFTLIPRDLPLENISYGMPKGMAAAEYYSKDHVPGQPSSWDKYKDDQLLSNPGGDNYYLGERKVKSHPEDQETFWGRLKKDISDSVDNVKNFFGDLFWGSERCYRGRSGEIKVAEKRGLVGSVFDFFKDLGRAFSFGRCRQEGERKPEGVMEGMGFFLSKIKKALLGDLFQGVAGGIIHMGEDLILAAWNLLEVLPDATLGNFARGKKLTTAAFDNGQVAIDYLTDILPGGEAWLRVHACNLSDLKDIKLPVVGNLNMPERSQEDERWKYVRNTPFRKAIETVGSLTADVLALKVLGRANSSVKTLTTRIEAGPRRAVGGSNQ